MAEWIRRRRNQVSIVFTAAIILITSNLIIPAYDSLSYYEGKSAALEKQYQQLYGYSLHIDHHEKISKLLQQQLEDLASLFSSQRNTAALQNKLGQIQKQCRLTVVEQEIKKGTSSPDLEILNVQQTLSGKYNSHIRYLNTIMDDDSTLLLKQYKLENQEPFKKNPLLTAHLHLTLFLPKK